MHQTDELRTTRIDNLITPRQLAGQFPVSSTIANTVLQARQRIETILEGNDPRLLVIIGPCSIHHLPAALDYAERLNQMRLRYQDRLEIVMRAYFEKPRTVIGWKGLISDPEINGTFRMNQGIQLARKILLHINQLGLPTGTEFLDMVIGQYIADLISWGAIGARTTESQVHREMASALSCPVGFKNGTDGNIGIAIDAIRASRKSHLFVSPDKDGQMTIYKTSGNPHGHIILRGGKKPNYYADDVASVCEKLRKFNLPERVIIDFSHGNSQKIHRQQLAVCDNVCQQIRDGSKTIIGIMAESFLQEGRQKITAEGAACYGQSITDPCLGWADTELLLEKLAAAVESRF